MAENPTPVGKSLCVRNDGTEVWHDDIVIPANLVFNFVEMHRKDYFDNHSLEYAVIDCLIPRGKAEILRAIKAGEKREHDAAAGKAVKATGLTPAQMVAEYVRLKMLEAAVEKAAIEAAKTDNKGVTPLSASPVPEPPKEQPKADAKAKK